MNSDMFRNIPKPEPLVIVISGPSGVGKDSVLNDIFAYGVDLHFVVTMTSRPQRSGEVNGRDYIFVTKDEFERMIAAGEFVEYALVYDQYKGVPKNQITGALASGKDVVLRLDVQGAIAIKKMFPDAVTIFLVPDSEESLVMRLKQRGTETEKQLRIRLETARKEMERLHEFNYVVENGQERLHKAVCRVLDIVRVEKMPGFSAAKDRLAIPHQ